LPSEEPHWLPLDVVIRINEHEVAETGEPFALLDQALLEMAVMKPQFLWHYDGEEDVVTLACALLFGICRNHPFQQGNKRTGFTAATTFLRLNGYAITEEIDGDALADVIVGVLVGAVAEAEFIDGLSRYAIRPIRPEK